MLNSLKDYNRHIHLLKRILAWPKTMKLTLEQRYMSVLHRQYHACWCSGDFRSQGISTHDTYAKNGIFHFPLKVNIDEIHNKQQAHTWSVMTNFTEPYVYVYTHIHTNLSIYIYSSPGLTQSVKYEWCYFDVLVHHNVNLWYGQHLYIVFSRFQSICLCRTWDILFIINHHPSVYRRIVTSMIYLIHHSLSKPSGAKRLFIIIIEIMAHFLLGAKPFPEPEVNYCQLEHQETHFSESWNKFLFKKTHWKMSWLKC